MKDFVAHELVAVNTLLHAARRIASKAGEDSKALEELVARIMDLYWSLRSLADRLGVPVWGTITPQFDWDALDVERLSLAYVFAWAAEQDNPGDLFAAIEAYKEQRLALAQEELRDFVNALKAIEIPQTIYIKYIDPGRQSLIKRAVIFATQKNKP